MLKRLLKTLPLFKNVYQAKKLAEQLTVAQYQLTLAVNHIALLNHKFLADQRVADGHGVSGDVLPKASCQQLLTVSLTTYGKRLSTVHLTILSLLRQTLKPQRLILWLAEDEFTLEQLPECLLELQQFGLEIAFCPDIRSYKKLIPALKRYPDDIIITFDDDVIYPQDQIERLYQAHLAEPAAVICHRAHRISKKANGDIKPYIQWPFDISSAKSGFDIYPVGIGGVLYPPGSLNPEVMNEPAFMRLCPYADDMWFKVMALKNLTPAKVVDNPTPYRDYLQTPGSQAVSLWESNREKNDWQLQALLSAYPELIGQVQAFS
ncbi:glycosyltransferase [Thalassomonas actiniarum]|uniref:Glycosyltransferase n=1 Tax=Thalassomonas actiniarum TaxID=485447 RepID=A0AAE9YUF7_9GAMM|nr:glycosyltransferase [Thalassomonas actiniarum]WDE00530.1 glycosyltransferase [Thalassomonas actiniarum]